MTGRRRLGRLAAAAVLAGHAAVGSRAVAGDAASSAQAGPPIDGARELYLLRCGGCHGIQGVSVPVSIPTLRGRAGVFLCTAAGRDYVLRLPNVQMALIRDDQALADVMNFVTFRLGGASAPRGARPFTAADVARSRGKALVPQAILTERDTLLRAAGSCAADYDAAVARFDGPY